MADVTTPQDLPLLSDYVDFVARHRTTLALFSCLGLLAGLALALGQSTTYSATATLALTPVPKYLTPSDTSLAPPEVSIDTDAQLLRSPQVVQAVADALGEGPDTAATRLSVAATANSQVLHVTVRADSPPGAAAAANAAVTALTDVRRRTLGSLQGDQLRQLRAAVTAQQRAVAEEQERGVVIADLDDLFARLVDLQSRIDELDQARTTPVEVLSPAQPPRDADYANTEVPLASGAGLGFLLGWVVGLGRDRRHQRPVPVVHRLDLRLEVARPLEGHHHVG